MYPPVPTGHVELGRCLWGPWQHRKQRGEQQALVSLCRWNDCWESFKWQIMAA